MRDPQILVSRSRIWALGALNWVIFAYIATVCWLIESDDHTHCIGRNDEGRVTHVEFTDPSAIKFDTEDEAKFFIEDHHMDGYTAIEHCFYGGITEYDVGKRDE